MLLVLGFAWALASAPMSSPDDDFHLASIWCAWGRETSGCTVLAAPPAPAPLTVSVPALGPHVSDCMAFKPDVSGSCTYTLPDGTTGMVQDRNYPSRANNGLYPGPYYSFMRLFATSNVVASMILMRFVSFVLSAGLILLAGAVLPRAERTGVWLFTLIASVPLGLFIFASSNPSSTAVAGAAAVLVGTYAALRSTTSLSAILASSTAAVGVLVACGSRSDAVYFCGVAVVLALVAAEGWSLRPLASLFRATAAPVAVLAIAWILRDDAVSGYIVRDVANTPAERFTNAMNVLSFYIGDFATAMGWLDARVPSTVWGLMALALGCVLILGVQGMSLGRGLALGMIGVGLLGFPLFMLDQWAATVGVQIQPRYLLPLLLMAAALLGMRYNSTGVAMEPSQRWLLVMIVSVAHAGALHTLMRRYLAGLDASTFNLNRIQEWWWQIPASPMLVWLLGSLAMTALLVMMTRRVSARPDVGQPTAARYDW